MKQHHFRTLPKRHLILCEGDSEVRYFISYRLDEENRERLRGLEIQIFRPVNHSPTGLVKEAKKLMKEAKKDKAPYESAWVVFDRNGHANIPSAFEEARTSIPPINVIFSVVCFEYWILLHFEKRKISFANGDAIVHHLKQKYIDNYAKAQLGYNHLKDKFDIAIENAQWLHQQNQNDLQNGSRKYELDAYTDIDLLMLFLKKLNN